MSAPINLNNETDILPSNQSFEGLDYGMLVPASTESSGVHRDNLMQLWVQVAWSVVFFVMIIIATGGNMIVIWIVVAHRRMRTVTNYFLVNLSIADLLLTTFNCVFNFIYMVQRDWPFGKWYCTVSNFIANATVAASVFTLTGISCDRYLAIVYPLHPRMSKTSSLITITLIWTASMIFALPCLLYSTTITNVYKGVQRTGCIIIWPDKKIIGSTYDLWYQMLFLIITYIVPMILMSMCYTMMGRVLWGSRSIGEKTQRQIDSIKSKRKVVKMFISVVMIFGICWLPYHSYFIYIYFDTTVIFSKYTQHVYLGFYWFAMSNAMVNPLIYYWMNARFRQYFKAVICGWKSCITHDMNIEDSPRNADNQSHSFSKSGDVGTVRVRISSNRDKDHRYRNGNALQHYSQLSGNNNRRSESNSPRDFQRSERWSHRSTSLKNKHVTTDL